MQLGATLNEADLYFRLNLVKVTGGNKRRAAQILCMDRATLYRRLARDDIDLDIGEQS